MDSIVSSSTILIRSYLTPARSFSPSSVVSVKPLSSAKVVSFAANRHILSFRSGGRRTNASSSEIRCVGIKEIGESEFSSTVLESDRPVLVEFVATWCGPCKLIYQAMESLSQVSYIDSLFSIFLWLMINGNRIIAHWFCWRIARFRSWMRSVDLKSEISVMIWWHKLGIWDFMYEQLL